MYNFSKNERVAFSFDKTTIGTVTRSTKTETRVQWDSGHETPVDPAELIRVNTSAQQPQEERPAGFVVKTEDGINGQEFFYCEGPKATAGQITVESFWNQPGGIDLHFTNDRHMDNGIFNMEELATLTGLIEEVTSKINYAAAQDFFENHPQYFETTLGVGKLAALADAKQLNAPEAFQAYMDLYNKRGGDNA